MKQLVQVHHHYPHCVQAYSSNLPRQGLAQCPFASRGKVKTHVIFIGVLYHARNDAIYSDILETIGKVENKQTGERLSLGDVMVSLASGQTR